jgi:hypothetical protein
MIALLLEYVLPNVLLFGSIYLLSRAAESAIWYAICNYKTITK